VVEATAVGRGCGFAGGVALGRAAASFTRGGVGLVVEGLGRAGVRLGVTGPFLK